MSKKLLIFVGAILLSVLNSAFSQDHFDKRVQDLLDKMTLEEKIGQMTQVTLEVVSTTHDEMAFKNILDLKKLKKAIVDYHVGSILNTGGSANSAANWQSMIRDIQNLATKKTRLKIPVLYGIDAIHGANYIKEGTLFPQGIAMGATWNRELVEKSAAITAREIRACGIPWNFNPVLGLARNPLWPRFWETFGEDSYAASEFGAAYVRGIEGDNKEIIAADKAVACMKHYLGYSIPQSGHDRTPAEISERTVRELLVPPFKAAVDAGVHTVMINSSEISGVPVHASYLYLTKILRDELGFEGLAVSDWADIENLYKREMVATDRKEAVKMAVMAGIDMSMVPMDFSFYDALLELVNDGQVPLARIDEAVGRILWVKFKLGLFENAYPNKKDLKKIGTPASRQVSLAAAQEVITLLKNKSDILPLSKDSKVLICGPTAVKLQSLNGGWTYTWQGNNEKLFPKDNLNILQAIQKEISAENVTYVPGTDFEKEIDIKKAVKAAEKSNVIVACLGEAAYCETPGNIKNLTLPEAQLQLVEALNATGKPIVLVLTEGRPRIIKRIVDKVDAIVMAYLPGPQGSLAIADVLFGDVNPSGKLPFTYPRYVNDLVTYDHKTSAETNPVKFNPQFEFGHGLSYTSFNYSDLKLSSEQMSKNGSIQVSVTVKNSGDRTGKEAVLLFVRDQVRSITPPVKQLKGFEKIMLPAGESKQITFMLKADDLSFIGRDLKRVTEAGEFSVMLGPLSQKFILK